MNYAREAIDSRGARQRAAVVYVTDVGFLLPSLVSAEQVQRQAGDIADVCIALVGFPDAEVPRVEDVMTSLYLHPLRMDELALPNEVTWLQQGLSLATLGRLYLPHYLPRTYRNVVYIDGDTQIVGDIRPLVELDVPSGEVAAAPDCGWLSGVDWFHPPAYLAGLGISEASRYCNAGVLAMTRETLDHVMPRALDFFLSHSDKCLYADQSALNAVMDGNFLRLSPRYNFMPPYFFRGVAHYFDPAILHFAGPHKPWKLKGWSPGDTFADTYSAMVSRYPYLKRYTDPVTAYVPPAPKRERFIRRVYNGPICSPIRTARQRQRLRSDIRRLPELGLH